MEIACPFLLAQSSADPAASLPGINGVLGTRGSLMMDVVVLSMLAVVPLMSWSIYLVRNRQRYQLHKQIQVALGLVSHREQVDVTFAIVENFVTFGVTPDIGFQVSAEWRAL